MLQLGTLECVVTCIVPNRQLAAAAAFDVTRSAKIHAVHIEYGCGNEMQLTKNMKRHFTPAQGASSMRTIVTLSSQPFGSLPRSKNPIIDSHARKP